MWLMVLIGICEKGNLLSGVKWMMICMVGIFMWL